MPTKDELIRLGHAAKALKTHEHFALLMGTIRADHERVFAESAEEAVDAWKEAHAILRAIRAIHQRLDWWIAEGNQAQKDKERERKRD
jgi:hypothetical protein